MSIDTDALDALIATFGWVAGLALSLVASSLLGLTVFWARALEEPGAGRILGRAALSFSAILMVTVGGMLVGVGTEASLGYPLGTSSGGTVLLAYLLGLALSTAELSLTFALARRLADRRPSASHEVLAWAAFGLGQIALLLTVSMAFVCLVTGLSAAFG